MARPDLQPLVDVVVLQRYLEERLEIHDAVEVERHQAGHSNETFFLRAGAWECVLRRPPRGAFLPTAHDVLREFRVLSALAGTGVRVPRPILACDDERVIGAPFYLMDRIDGVVIRDELPAALRGDEADRRRIGEELVDALVELHAVDAGAVGLEGFGKPDGYLRRQVRRWQGQLVLTEPMTRNLPELHRVGEWLDANIPVGRQHSIVHGDYKLDNVAFASSGPAKVVAILDWEMSTLGDPLADVGWMLSFWREPADPVEFAMDEQAVSRLPGFPSRDELAARYADRSGRALPDLTFYLALATWKLAVLLEGSYARHLAGFTDDPFFEELAEGVPALARRALAFTRS
ncbi:MAG: phosphotransferase family protein [Actinobacteria bacterium]|nr:MAG: phosphotransferase family protein [Actinomycetota bacterium]